MYLTITDQGDESVGIFPESWDVPCPFVREDVDEEDLKIFKASAISLYSQYALGRVVAQYEFEILAAEVQYNEAASLSEENHLPFCEQYPGNTPI